MGTALTGNTIASSYLGLLKSTDSLAIGGTKKIITDGAGNNLPFGISTFSLTFNGGAVDVPTLSIGSINDGFYQPTDETIGVTVNGTEVARFLSTGLSLTSSKLTLNNDQKIRWTSDDVYIQGTTSSDNIQLGVGGSTQFTFAQTTGLRLHQYGGGSITGTVTQRLGVTSTGQVVEIPIGAGAVDGTGTAGKIVKWSDSDTITDSLLTESTNSVSLADNKELILGNDSDLTIKHSSTGNQNLIKSDTHQLFITSDVGMELADNGGKSYFEATEGGSSRLFFNNSKKIETTNTGVSITGDGTFTASATIETGINLESGVLVIKNSTGDSSGLRIFQDSSDASKIYNNFNGTLQLGVGNTTAITIDSSENTTFNGDVTLSHIGNTLLTIQSTDDNAILKIDANSGGTGINANQDPFLQFASGGTIKANIHYDNTATNLIFQTNTNATALTIDNSQNANFNSSVGIGHTSTPDSALDVRKNDSATTPILTLRQLGAGDSSINFQTTTSPFGFNMGVDGSDSDSFKIAVGLGDVGTDTAIKIDTSKNATFSALVTAVSLNLSDFAQIKVDDAEFYWTNTANNDYWRWKRDASNNFTLDHFNGSSTNDALSFDSSQNATFSGDVTSQSYFSAESVGDAYIRFKHGTGDLNYVGSSESLTGAFGDENDMLNYSSSGKWGVYTAGTLALTLEENNDAIFTGNVGIGLTSFSNKLAVSGSMPSAGIPLIQFNETSGNARDGVYLNYTGTTNSAVYSLKIADATKTHLAVRGDGNVGINETNPATKLQISGSGAEELLRLSGQSGFMSFFDGSTRTGFIQSDNLNGFFNIGVEDSNAFRIFMGASESLRINSSGNSLFQGGINLQDSGTNKVWLTRAETILGGSDDDFLIYTETGLNIRLYTSGNERLRVDSTGNVSIGDTDNNGRILRVKGSGDLLQLTSTNAGAGGAQIDLTHESASPADGDNVGIINFGGFDSASNPTNYATITGIATSVSSETGGLSFRTRTNASTYTEKMRLDHNGDLTVIASYSGGTDPFRVGHGTYDSFTPTFLIDDNGNVGINQTAPVVPVHIVGTAVNNPSNGTGGYEVMQVFDDTAYATGVGGGIGLGGKFHSNGTDTIFGEIRGIKENATDTNYASALTFSTRENGASITEQMRITSDGNLGLGLSDPTNSTNYKTLDIRGTSGGQIILGRTGVDFFIYSTSASTHLGSSTGQDLVFHTNSSGSSNERLRIDSSGNMGLSNTSMSSFNQLTTQGTAPVFVVGNGTANPSITIFSDNANVGSLAFAMGTTTTEQYKGLIQYNHGTNGMSFYTDATERVVVTSTGLTTIKRTGITGFGKNDMTLQIGFEGNNGQHNLIGFGFNGGTEVPAYIGYTTTSGSSNTKGDLIFATRSVVTDSTPTERVRITNNGSLCVNTTDDTPNGVSISASIVGLNDGTRFAGHFATSTSASSTAVVFSNSNGLVGTITTESTSTAYNTSSDYRLKEDLQDFNALEIASKIRMYDFKWKEADSRSYGVMAHELQEVLPQAVSGDKDAKDMQQVDYSKLVPILLKSIQELEARVQELEKEI